MSRVVKGKNQLLQWIGDLMAFFQVDAISVPKDYRTSVLQVKTLLNDDTSGLVTTILDFAITSALVDFKIETDNENLTKVLNEWLGSVNSDLRGKVPTGLNALAKEYYRERWKGSSQLLLRTFFNTKNGLKLPTSLFFVDGEDIIVEAQSKDGAVRLGEETYGIRLNDNGKKVGDKNVMAIPKEKNEYIFVQRPYESWSARRTTPYVIKRGLFRNLKFLQLMSSKGEFIVGKALEYMLMIKKGTEATALSGRAELVYDDNDLKKVSQDLADLINKKKNEGGAPTYTTNFDTEISEYIPEYQKAINDTIYAPIERRLLAGLGMIDMSKGMASTRKEDMFNPKPFISEVNQAIQDFKAMIYDLIEVIKEENKSSHPKWMNAKIKIYNTPIKEFVDDKLREKLRSVYDRGGLSKRTFVEIVSQCDYDLEVSRRKEEQKKKEDDKYDYTMCPPIVQNVEKDVPPTGTEPIKKEKVPSDKKGIEKKNFKQAMDDEEGSRIIGEPVDPLRDDIEEGKVVKRKDGWHVVSKEGKNLGGPYKTKKEAVKRLQEVEYFKHKGEENLDNEEK